MKELPSAVIARHDQIMRWLAAEGRLDVLNLAGRLGVAQETVRRDLRVLETGGRLQRVHGGAVPVETDPFPPGFPSSAPPVFPAGSVGGSPTGPAAAGPTAVFSAAELAWAERVWARLPRSGTVLLGAGRHTLAVIAAVGADPPTAGALTVVSNSLDAAIAAARVSELSVYNIGGAVSPRTRAQEGDWALQELERLQVDVSLVCPAGISFEHGLGQPTPAAAAVSQAEVRCGQNVIVLVDAVDLGRPAFVQFATWREIDSLMVSGRPDPALLGPFVEQGIDVVVAGPDVNDHRGEGVS